MSTDPYTAGDRAAAAFAAPGAYVMDAAANAQLEPWKRSALQMAIDAATAAARQVPTHPPALLPITVAQYLLESGWGRHDCGGARNFFGIKARDGEPYVELGTTEVVNGQTVRTAARFRRYASVVECFVDHARLICERRRSATGPLIYAKAMQHPDDPCAFARALTGVYATDPQYGDKLIAIMRDRGLFTTFGFAECR